MRIPFTNWSVLVSVLGIFFLQSCSQEKPLFVNIDPSISGLQFSNNIVENNQLNVLNYEYIYNGGGVGIGDFNNDSLPDIYFTGNRVANKLFLNKGNLQFEDITEKAGVDGKGKWNKGVSIIDINNDGLLDIYVCAAVLPDSNSRKNILYVNQGVDAKSGIPAFKELAQEYGLDDVSNTHMASFFDYDNDGDLDVYLLINDLDGTYPNEFRPIRKDGSWPNTDKLLQNNYDTALKHPVFKDVSKQAGILIEGHGLGINITDINNDGWKDIYISNDYLSNNILYINNKNGTFTDQCSLYFKHTSKNAMGNDIADINNDGKPDIIETDMMPADNYRQKMMHSDISYQTFQNSDRYGYIYQYPTNTLQLNQGMIPTGYDSVSRPAFSEIAYYSGVAHTDWSWAPLLADFNNDGWRDLFVTNGLPKDMSDKDFMAYRQNAYAASSLDEVLRQVPEVKISNYVYQNNGDLTFTDMTQKWGVDFPTFSAGMAYADLDRDGDMDLVINNTNMPATLLENRSIQENESAHYLKIKFKGSKDNLMGMGATVQVFDGARKQVAEVNPYRGYLSSVEAGLHFGMGATENIDSILIVWPDKKSQLIKNVSTNQQLILDYADAKQSSASEMLWYSPSQIQHQDSALPMLMTDITKLTNLNFGFSEVDFIDFDIQRMLLHKLTQNGPSLAAGDINGDGLDDVVVGGGSPFHASLFVQTTQGKFTRKYLPGYQQPQLQDDAGILLFDADNDKDLDIYIAAGGAENQPQTKAYADHFYQNDGKGNFKELLDIIPTNLISKSCVVANDYDSDGDLDLFVGGRVTPGRYPLPLSSFIYRNDSNKEGVRFTDVTKQIAPSLVNTGMVTAAIWSDINNDGKSDLFITKEWGAPMILQNNGKQFIPVATTLDAAKGWYNSIVAADMDNDGDMDYLLGNFGKNAFLKASAERPVSVYAKDFDNNFSLDVLFSHWQLDKVKGQLKEVPVAGRDVLLREMSSFKVRYPNYASYASASLQELITPDQLKEAFMASVTELQSYWIENKGGFTFETHPLPAAAQMAPVFGLVATDVNGDGYADIILNGNDYGISPYLGQQDALHGLVLLNTGKKSFKELSIAESGFYSPGNGKSLVLLNVQNKPAILSGQNRDFLRIFQLNLSSSRTIFLDPNETAAVFYYKNGQVRKEEYSYGQGFLSQSSRFCIMDEKVDHVMIYANKGLSRKIK